MREVSGELAAWYADGRPFALASVVSVGGSAPREPGAVLAVDADGVAVGSVSGGCVEGAVYELCREVLETGVPVLTEFGYSDDDAFAVGLTCGGTISVYVQPVTPLVGAALEAVEARRPVALARDLAGAGTLLITPDGVRGTFGDPVLDRAVTADAAALLDSGRTGRLSYTMDGCPTAGGAPDLSATTGAPASDRPSRSAVDPGQALDIFVETYAPPPRLLVFGAIDFAASLVTVGKFLGYHVTVCDARPIFATPRRFPDADEVVVDWPHRYLRGTEVDARTAICVLTHDLKFDVPLLTTALRLPVGYVGAMGSRRTHAQRLAALREAGLSPLELTRLKSPIGLDLGGRTPEETALSIAAELVAVRHGGTGRHLSAVDSPIHHHAPAPRRAA